MELQQIAGLTLCLTKAGLAAGTTTTVSTGGAVTYAIGGKGYSAAQLTNGAAPTTDFVTGNAFLPVNANQGSLFVHGFDAAGNLRVVQGSVEALDSAGNFIDAPKLPPMPDNFCPIGYLLVQVGSTGSAWTYGASNQSGATGVTYTRQDLIALPSRLQTS